LAIVFERCFLAGKRLEFPVAMPAEYFTADKGSSTALFLFKLILNKNKNIDIFAIIETEES
jgi:hypothetical protein